MGATTAMRIADSGLADVILLDVVEGLAEGKAFDISDAQSILAETESRCRDRISVTETESRIRGTQDYSQIDNSDIVVVTAGLPRRPGMSRQDLLVKNGEIVKEVVVKIKHFCPKAIIIMVTNPLDAMTCLAYRVSGFKSNRVIGMAGGLDVARFSNLVAKELNVPAGSIKTMVIGEHGDSMLPLARWTTVSGKPLIKLLPKEKIDKLIDETRKAGAKIVRLLKRSAYFGPSAAIFQLVEAILKDTKQILCVSAVLSGEYGLDDICIGVPAKIGKNGVEEIVELDLNGQEKTDFYHSAQTIRLAETESRCRDRISTRNRDV